MSPQNLWDLQLPLRTLYSLCIEPLCESRGITRTEFDILLFLANNPKYDTAAEICDVRRLAKSHVSVSLKSLRERGYIAAHSEDGDRRRAHIRLTERAEPVVREGRERQAEFARILFDGLGEEERGQFHACLARIGENIESYLEGRAK